MSSNDSPSGRDPSSGETDKRKTNDKASDKHQPREPSNQHRIGGPRQDSSSMLDDAAKEIVRRMTLTDETLQRFAGSSSFHKQLDEINLRNSILSGNPVGITTASKQLDLDEQIHSLKRKIYEQRSELEGLRQGSTENEEQIKKLLRENDELTSKIALRHLIERVGEQARIALLDNNKLADLFSDNESCFAFVVSIDLRRSTDLMLKTREPLLFVRFITSLTKLLREIILANYGVFDKFTGDGILAYFPDFFSGPSAGALAVEAAERCHKAFQRHYRECRSYFMAVMQDTGLGIGIDYGKVAVVHMAGDLTMVGTPVVYACRLSGAEAGQTLVNQPAYEKLLSDFSEYVDFTETSIDFKHEGSMLAYCASRNGKKLYPSMPEWLQVLESESADGSIQHTASSA